MYTLNSTLALDNGSSKDESAAKILFRETWYGDEMKKCRLLCLDTYLRDPCLKDKNVKDDAVNYPENTRVIKTSIHEVEEANSIRLTTVRGCIDFIYYELGGQNLLRKIEQLAHDFEQWLGTKLTEMPR